MGFQSPGQQRFLFDGLLREFGINARAAQKDQPPHSGLIGQVQYVALHHQILVDELCRSRIVGKNTTDFCCGQKDAVGFFSRQKGLHRDSVQQVQLGMRPQQKVGEAFGFQLPHNGGTHKAAVSCDKNFLILFFNHLVHLKLRFRLLRQRTKQVISDFLPDLSGDSASCCAR